MSSLCLWKQEGTVTTSPASSAEAFMGLGMLNFFQ